MSSGTGRFLRDNAFLVAAVALPLVVVGFFLVSSTIPGWLVPGPTHDLLVRGDVAFGDTSQFVAIEFHVRDGTVEATVRPVAERTYARPVLFLVDHATLTAREIPVDVPAMAANDPPQTIVVRALADRRALPQPEGPDGYRVEYPNYRTRGLLGEVFGMNDGYDRQVSLVNRGRVVPVRLSPRYPYLSSVRAVGWLEPVPTDGKR